MRSPGSPSSLVSERTTTAFSGGPDSSSSRLTPGGPKAAKASSTMNMVDGVPGRARAPQGRGGCRRRGLRVGEYADGGASEGDKPSARCLSRSASELVDHGDGHQDRGLACRYGNTSATTPRCTGCSVWSCDYL